MSLENIRTLPYTMEEFNSLPRNADGDLTSMFDHFILLTPEQVALLSEDDHSRYNEYQDELNYELSLLSKEFRVGA